MWNCRPEIRKLGAFDVLGMARADTAGQAVFRYVLTTFEVGNQTIPPVAIPVRSGGRVDTLRSNPWRVTVESLLPADSVAADSAQLRPAAAPLALRGAFRWGVFFLYLAVIAALILGGRWLWARRPKKALLPAFVPAPVVPPPDAVALEALDAVAARAYVERGLFKPHYTEVMDVLRTYVEGRYSLEALDRTTPELIEAMREKSIAPGLRGTLAGLLEEADLVKFARVTPDAASARALLDAARSLGAGEHGGGGRCLDGCEDLRGCRPGRGEWGRGPLPVRRPLPCLRRARRPARHPGGAPDAAEGFPFRRAAHPPGAPAAAGALGLASLRARVPPADHAGLVGGCRRLEWRGHACARGWRGW